MSETSCLALERLRLGVGLAIAGLGMLMASTPSMSSTVVGNGIVLSCSQPKPLEMRCDYRLTASGRPLAAAAAIGAVTLPAPSFAARTESAGSVAVLFLADTSDPGREPAIRKVEQHVTRLVERASPGRRFGLAAFDSDLRLLAPIGSTPAELKAAAATLKASGPTTELYRNIVQAAKLLATATDEHKVLVVLSDGLAEDRAYFHEDAVGAALEARIAIYGIGYPRSVALSVGLQSLRRLAEDTGGKFVAASTEFAVPDSFFTAPFAEMENVGALSADLGAAAALPGGPEVVRLVLETSSGVVTAEVPIALPVRSNAEPVVKVVEVEVPRVVEVEKVVPVPQPLPAPAATPPATSGVPLWYWVAAIGILALALLVLLVILLLQRRAEPSLLQRSAHAAAPAPPLSSFAPILGGAMLILEDDPERPHPITGEVFRIGRLEDNDLALHDPSVSRHHAEIRRQPDGRRFQVSDLDSLNGVLINGKSVTDGELAHGDLLEVGDVRMTLHVEPFTDGADDEEAVMLGAGVSTQLIARRNLDED